MPKKLVDMTEAEINDAFDDASLMPAILDEARSHPKPITVVALVMESTELGERIVLSSIEHGDNDGIEYIRDSRDTVIRRNLLLPGETLRVMLYHIESARGIEIG